MKQTAIFLLILFAAGCLTQANSQQMTTEQKTKIDQTKDQTKKSFVLVELFTSEGCSSCPPVDKVLARLQNEQPVKDVEIVPLALHVDYWNNLGWKDEFSSADYSRRQSGYADEFKSDSIYTPQMVVDGQKEFVGSQYDTAIDSVKNAVKTKKADVDLTLENNQLKVNIADLPKHDVSYVWLVITEDNLQTDVRRGENSGRKLSHTGVVREMRLLGNVTGKENNYSATAAIKLQPNWKKENLNVVVFVQEQDSKGVFAVGKEKFVQ